eukprot:6797-Prymnesium_polylepis.1
MAKPPKPSVSTTDAASGRGLAPSTSGSSDERLRRKSQVLTLSHTGCGGMGAVPELNRMRFENLLDAQKGEADGVERDAFDVAVP